MQVGEKRQPRIPYTSDDAVCALCSAVVASAGPVAASTSSRGSIVPTCFASDGEAGTASTGNLRR